MDKSTESQDQMSDSELLKLVGGLVNEEKHLEAARLLRQIKDQSLLSDRHRKLLAKVIIIENAMNDLLSSPEETWTKQGETHGPYDFTLYYKVEDGARLTCRIESPIPHSLLVPLLSVLNESDLYQTWIPSFRTPFKLGVQESKQLLNDTRGHQVIQVTVGVPFPLKTREALFSVQAVDEIETNGLIIAKMTSIGDTAEGEIIKSSLPDNFDIPLPSRSTERVDFEGVVIFRHCPTDHPNYDENRKKYPGEDLILTQFAFSFDAKITLPQSMINFFTRSAMGMVWNMLLRVAEKVRDGTREEHCNAIAQKADFYDWVEERCKYMIENYQDDIQREHGNGDEQDDGLKENEIWTLQEILRMNL